MKSVSILILLLFCTAVSLPQSVDITVNGLSVDRANLSALIGEKTSQIDSIHSSANGKFHFSLHLPNNNPGFYRLTFDKNRWLDFLNDGKEIVITTDATNILDSLKVVSSESNRLFYSFARLNRQYRTKSDLLQLILARYPKDDEFYRTALTTLRHLQQQYMDFVHVTSQKEPRSFVARYIRSAQLPVLDPDLPPEKQLPFLKAHALENVDFGDDGLVCSDLFTSKCIEYLTYYRNPQLPKDLLEKEFIVAIDTILNKAKVSQIVYQHIVEYLIDGFKKFGFDKPIDYIVENYVIKDDLCLDSTLEGLIKRRIDQAKNFKIGMVVPNIALPDTKGKEVALSSVKSEKTLIIFYASSCPHCRTMLPQLEALYEKQKSKTLEVLAVSLDTKKDDWLNFINAHKLKWLNVSDLKGWDSKAAGDYFIYATPTMFLVDGQMNIIAKPTSIEELDGLLAKR